MKKLEGKFKLTIKAIRYLVVSVTFFALLTACVPQNVTDIARNIGGSTPVPALPSLNNYFTDGFITSNVNDALPEATWLDTSASTPVASQSFDIVPGYYQYQLQSYCLKAGTHGPTSGSGYLVAPVVGTQGPMIQTILRNSALNLDIPQQDIQIILWTIRAGGSLLDMTPVRQAYMARLAEPAQIASYEALVSSENGIINQFAMGLLPQGVRDALSFYDSFRNTMNDVNATYADIEALAVLTGFVEPGPGSIDVAPGTWHSIEENTFMRIQPQGYSKSVVEVLKVAPFRLERDEVGRITVFQSGPYRTETSYYDEPSYFAGPDGTNYASWEIKTARFIGPEAGQDVTIENAGWILPSTTTTLTGSDYQEQMTRADYATPRAQSYLRFNRAGEVIERYNSMKERADFYRERYGRATAPPTQADLDNMVDLNHYNEGLEAALKGGGLPWLIDHFERQARALNYINCIFAGQCAPPGADEPIDAFRDEPTTVDPTTYIGAPANTNRQRIGQSPRFW